MTDRAARELRVRAGKSAPLGATVVDGGVRFALHAPRATAVWLAVGPAGRGGARHDLALDPAVHRRDGVWHVEVLDVAAPLEWAWRVDAPAAAAGPEPSAD